jgi:stage II sporulation protein AA (anti-sigma F factor antagonist)
MDAEKQTGGNYMEEMFSITGTTLVIHLPSELDHHASEQIRGEADRLIMHHQIRQVLFDFGRTMFMDSSGIGMMIGRYKMIRFMGGNAAAIRVGPQMQRVLTLSGLGRVMELYEGVPEEYSLL